ncbi:OmpA family protein [Paraburkholderia sp. NMBU_R16]|uniref:OmpA/MotB family protein n=1 Tax=Paraburkholderia sp. NMBU_R16 TaxID=2698676 RepID=UPI001564BA6E|nr:OmpA family protein [Paraburkholderia sp. NMBU_R16]NRO97253.1 OmpA family protein [Paraburkholderia sp. NMBU_R16]
MNIFAGGKRLASDIGGREREEDSDEHSERWLISYADLITTLMVFFLALYVLQLARYRELESKAFEQRIVKQHEQAAAASAANARDGVREGAKKTLMALLEPFRDSGQIAMVDTPQGLEIAINARVLFNSGDARLLPDSFAVLTEVAQVLADHSTRNVLVEGHSDSIPISNAKYASNWELSSARAGAVVRFLVDKGVAPHRLSAVGRADNDPLVLGGDEAARAANRRVTILVQY